MKVPFLAVVGLALAIDLPVGLGVEAFDGGRGDRLAASGGLVRTREPSGDALGVRA
jgi:hypothetical protein